MYHLQCPFILGPLVIGPGNCGHVPDMVLEKRFSGTEVNLVPNYGLLLNNQEGSQNEG